MSNDKKPEINGHLFWMDLETTGLDAEGEDVILEVSVVVTDPLLSTKNVFNRVVHHCREDLPEMDPVVVDMHTKSHLFRDVEHALDSSEVVENQLVEFLSKYPGQLVLCGSTIHFDRRFVRRRWKRVEERLHYRMIDVSSVKLLGRIFYGVEKPKGAPAAHRAFADVSESIQELRYWRDSMFHDPEDADGEILRVLQNRLQSVNCTTSGEDYLNFARAYEILKGVR